MRTASSFASEGGRDGASYAAVALNAAKDIQDRVKGKARQQIDVTSTALTFNIDMSGHATSGVPD
jgi:hypothetical protein